MNELQEYRDPNILGKAVSFLMIGTFGGAMIMLIVSSILLAKTVSISKDIRQNNDATLSAIVNIQERIETESEAGKQEIDAALTEVRTAADTINGKVDEVKNYTPTVAEPKIEVVIDEDTVRKVVTEYLSERQQESPEPDTASTSDTLDKAIDRETEMMLRMMELLVDELEEME